MTYKQLKNKIEMQRVLIKQDKWLKQFTCDYCPSTGHKLCSHKDKCLMDSRILDLVVEISRVNNRIAWIKSGKVDKETRITLEKLFSERKRLFREYYSIETNVGGE